MKNTETCAWNNAHTSNDPIGNLTAAPQLDDGCYMQLFAVKDGVRYYDKIVSMQEVSKILAETMMDGIERIWGV